MKWNVEPTHEFERMAKKLYKKYKSLIEDLNDFRKELEKNPFQGVVLYPGIRKIRMAIKSKGGGKSKGARIITLTFSVDEKSGKIVLLLIYDHNQADTVDTNIVKNLAIELGYDIDSLLANKDLK